MFMRIVDLGTDGSVRSVAQGINNAGQIVGGLEDPSHAFRWDAATQFTDLGDLEGFDTVAWSINEAGDAVGASWVRYAGGQEHALHAALWAADGTTTDLGALGGAWAWATDINDEGQIVGFIHYDTYSRAFVRHPGGELVDIGTLGGKSSRAWGVNNAGQVVGWSGTGHGTRHAFLWRPGAGMLDLGTLDGANSEALAISDRGQVVGQSDTRFLKAPRAFSWIRGTMTALPIPAGTRSSAANAINAHGEIAGAVAGDKPLAACVWKDGVPSPLPALFKWSAANGINDLGQIVGVAGSLTGRNAALWDHESIHDQLANPIRRQETLRARGRDLAPREPYPHPRQGVP
jgi:probable HAF family extracellular repeat protein